MDASQIVLAWLVIGALVSLAIFAFDNVWDHVRDTLIGFLACAVCVTFWPLFALIWALNRVVNARRERRQP